MSANKLCLNSGPKPFCLTKPTYFGFKIHQQHFSKKYKYFLCTRLLLNIGGKMKSCVVGKNHETFLAQIH
jgi:hypothetical protein